MNVTGSPADRGDTLPDKNKLKCRDACESEDAAIGKDLEIIVVGLLDSKLTVPRIVTRKRDAERIETGAEYRVLQEYLPRNTPEMRAAAGHVGLTILLADPA